MNDVTDEQMEDKKIVAMFIDDDDLLRGMYKKKFLGEGGFEVLTCGSVEECIDMLKEGAQPDICMFDMIMPGLTGLDLMKQVKGEDLAPETLFIALTNQSDQSDIDAAKEAGVDGYIIKANTTPTIVLNKVKEIYSSKKK